MKGDKKRRKPMFKLGNKCRLGRQSVFKLTPNSEYVRPTVEEAKLMDVDPVVHDAMASTSTSTDQKLDVMLLRPRLKQPEYKCTGSRNTSYLG